MSDALNLWGGQSRLKAGCGQDCPPHSLVGGIQNDAVRRELKCAYIIALGAALRDDTLVPRRAVRL
jgi:hypothetical protein